MLCFIKNIAMFRLSPHLLMVCVLLWVFAQISAVSAADNPVSKQAFQGFLGDVRSVLREPDEEVLIPVAGRTFPMLVPKGFAVGKLIVLPSLGVGAVANDNLFATENDKTSDVASVFTPRISAHTLRREVFFGFDLGGEIKRYVENEDENVEDLAAQAGGYVELKHNVKIPWSASYGKTHQDRTNNLSRVFTKKPLEIETLRFEGGISYRPNRFGLLVLGRNTSTSFDDGVSLQDSSVEIIRSDSDFTTNEIEIEGGYTFRKNHYAFLKTGLGDTKYDRGIYNANTKTFTSRFRDSKNLSMLAGLVSNYKGLVFSEIEAGYQSLNFDDDTIDDVENIVLDAQVDWNVTKLSTLGFRANRSVVQDNEIIQGVVNTQGAISYDYEVLRKLVLNGQLTYLKRDFDNVAREDDIYHLGLGFLYRPSPYYNVTGEYIYSTQDSTLAGNDFDSNLFMLRLTGQY